AEIDSHLTQDLNRNRKNGYATKTMKSEHGEFELNVPRDRAGSFEPEIVKKNERTMSGEIEEKILTLYSHGNSYSQIVDLIENIYGVGFSKGAISAVTDKIIPMLQEWIDDYNHHRPHAVLGKLSPIEYLNKYNLEMNYSV
nr:transposase [Sulfurospirillum sp.]